MTWPWLRSTWPGRVGAGRAIEPVVREALLRLAPSIPGMADVVGVGPWWNRDNSIEVDLVASTHSTVHALGTIKWRDRRKVTVTEVRELAATRASVPHAGHARLLVACPAGADTSAGADLVLTADDLLRAWSADLHLGA